MYRFTTTMMTFALALGFQSVHAASPQDPPSIVTRFADLDLSRSEGARVLYQRLKAAANTVCASLDDRAVARHSRFKECVQSAISTAVARVDQPTLTAYYEAETNGHKPTIQIAKN